MQKKKHTASLEALLTYLLSAHGGSKTSPFFPHVLRALVKRPVPNMGTFGVSITPEGKLLLMYDPKILERLSVRHAILVLIHEVYHIVLHHIPRGLRLLDQVASSTELEKRKFFAISNIAADYAVNSLMVQCGECIPSDFKLMGEKDPKTGKYDFAGCYPTDSQLPERKTYEWYFNALMSDLDNFVQQLVAFMKAAGTLGEGEGPKGKFPTDEEIVEALERYREMHAPTNNDDELKRQSDQMNPDQRQAAAGKAERESRQAVRKAKEETQKSRGSLPAGLEEYISNMLEEAEIPWQQFFKTWLQNTLRHRRKRSMCKPRRRLLDMEDICEFPGRMREKIYTIIFAIDTSGSMSNSDIADALSELRGMQAAAPGIQITVIECDAQIGREYTIDEFTEPQRNVTGRGGTRFEPVFERAAQLKADALIYATDGYGSLPSIELMRVRPLCWLVTHNGVAPWEAGYGSGAQYGHVIRLKR